MQAIEQLSRDLYADIPRGGLYHYTTFSGLLGIIGKRCLWASDIRYMNDSAELRHTADLFAEVSRERMASGQANSHLLTQFVDWIKHRITSGHLLFAQPLPLWTGRAVNFVTSGSGWPFFHSPRGKSGMSHGLNR